MSWTLILANLPALITAGHNLFDYIAKVRAAAQQASEWTPEHEAQFQSLLEAAAATSQWQPDAPA